MGGEGLRVTFRGQPPVLKEKEATPPRGRLKKKETRRGTLKREESFCRLASKNQWKFLEQEGSLDQRERSDSEKGKETLGRKYWFLVGVREGMRKKLRQSRRAKKMTPQELGGKGGGIDWEGLL